MQNFIWTSNFRKKQKGQVLILAIVALLILILAIFSLFDIQNLIRGKVKSQSAVDAAAIAGANWQRHTLNLVGELNMIKATTLLIDESIFGIGADSDAFLSAPNKEEYERVHQEQRLKQLTQASDLLSQMQYRILFIGPLIGVGAAQAAAKNNGLNSYNNFGRAVAMQNSMLAGFDERSAIYDHFKQDEYCSQFLYGFQWHVPYLNMMTVLQHPQGKSGLGFAVMPSGEMLGAPSLYTDPPASPDFSKYLGRKLFYEAVRGDDFCYLREFLLSGFSSSKWWGDIKVRQNTNFPKESEFLPVKVRIGEASSTEYDMMSDYGMLEDLLERTGQRLVPLGEKYDWTDPKYDDQGNVVVTDDSDNKLNPLPAIDWAFYKDDWVDYHKTTVRNWERYLRGSFRPEASYHSGAVARMDSFFSPNFLFTNRGGNDHQFSEAIPEIKGSGEYVSRLKTAENILQSSPPTIHAYALAKPFGRLKIGKKLVPPHYSSIVLPVFFETALIPVALENPGMNPLADFNWYLFLLNYMPELGKVNSLDSIPGDLQRQFRTYHNILKKADNPAWRQFGIDWLERPLAYDEDGNVTVRQKDRCNYWPGGSGENGIRTMPAAKH